MRPDYEAQFQRFYYDLYTLSYCLAYSEKGQEERNQIKKDQERQASAPPGTKIAAGPYAIDQIFRSFDMARRVSESAGAFFGAPGQFESRIKSATTPKEFMDIFRELMLVMKKIQTEFTEEQEEKAARHLRQAAEAIEEIARNNYGVTDDDILNAQKQMEKKDAAKFLAQFYETGQPSLRQMAMFSESSDFETFRPEGGFTQAHAKLEEDVEKSKENAINLLCKGSHQDILPKLNTLNKSIRSILNSREAGSVFTSAIDSAMFNLSKNAQHRDAYIREKLPDVLSRAINAVVGDRYRRNDVEGARRILEDFNRLALNASKTRHVSRRDLEKDPAAKKGPGIQPKRDNSSGGRVFSQPAQDVVTPAEPVNVPKKRNS